MLYDNCDPIEVERFNQLAQHWWDPNGPCAILHRINPLRLSFVKDLAPLSGKRVLDVGCGAGILSESLAQAGAIVTGIDAAQDLIDVADAHQNHLNIRYLNTTAESLARTETEPFDVITCMELLEHVPNPMLLLGACKRLLKPNGYLFLSTLNRTPAAYLLAIFLAERILRLLPKETHRYSQFIRPHELEAWCREIGLQMHTLQGFRYNPISKRASLTKNLDVNYLTAIFHPAQA